MGGWLRDVRVGDGTPEMIGQDAWEVGALPMFLRPITSRFALSHVHVPTTHVPNPIHFVTRVNATSPTTCRLSAEILSIVSSCV